MKQNKPGPILPPEPFDYVEPKEARRTILISLALLVFVFGLAYFSVVE